jgi:hypothetical protein
LRWILSKALSSHSKKKVNHYSQYKPLPDKVHHMQLKCQDMIALPDTNNTISFPYLSPPDYL